MVQKTEACINGNMVPNITICTSLNELSSPLTVGPDFEPSSPLFVVESCTVAWPFSESCRKTHLPVV